MVFLFLYIFSEQLDYMREIYKDLMSGMKDGGPAHDLAAEMVNVINQMLETKTRTLVSPQIGKMIFRVSDLFRLDVRIFCDLFRRKHFIRRQLASSMTYLFCLLKHFGCSPISDPSL